MELARSNLTPRDRALLDALTQRVRALSVGQIARTWFSDTADPVRNAERRLRSLAAGGLVERLVMSARPELVLSRPLLCWAPRQPAPDFGRLAYQLESRWTAPAMPTRLVVASRAAGAWLGGSGGRRPRRSEVSHDLTLAGLYLRRLAEWPEIRELWLSEARLRRLGYGDDARLPDAMIRERDISTAIEVGGTYSAQKLVTFHEFCAGRELRYELW